MWKGMVKQRLSATGSYMRKRLTTPIGALEAIADGPALVRLGFVDDEERDLADVSTDDQSPVFDLLEVELEQYFAGCRQSFSVPIDLRGTLFQVRVWDSLRTVPHGQTRTYAEQSRLLGDERAIRAVARANGANPIAIIIPCHRIIGAGGKLTGYAGGIERKRWLLQHEGTDVPGLGISRQTVLGL
jgi:O-6-methylguanine DNA methyltransferase